MSKLHFFRLYILFTTHQISALKLPPFNSPVCYLICCCGPRARSWQQSGSSGRMEVDERWKPELLPGAARWAVSLTSQRCRGRAGICVFAMGSFINFPTQLRSCSNPRWGSLTPPRFPSLPHWGGSESRSRSHTTWLLVAGFCSYA